MRKTRKRRSPANAPQPQAMKAFEREDGLKPRDTGVEIDLEMAEMKRLMNEPVAVRVRALLQHVLPRLGAGSPLLGPEAEPLNLLYTLATNIVSIEAGVRTGADPHVGMRYADSDFGRPRVDRAMYEIVQMDGWHRVPGTDRLPVSQDVMRLALLAELGEEMTLTSLHQEQEAQTDWVKQQGVVLVQNALYDLDDFQFVLTVLRMEGLDVELGSQPAQAGGKEWLPA